jgi:large subunit ribosomal protein L24
MKSKFTKTWKSSTQPRRQRKYRYNAPIHIRRVFLSVNISKDLRAEYGTRNAVVRKGDKVRILRGNHKTKEAKVSAVSIKKSVVYLEGMENTRREGAKSRIPFQPSNLQIVELDLTDKVRKEKLKSLKKQEK